ncbi:hypothetical protein ESCO_006370 [Escovopsis weberi]|uniref:Uncharacterized protein n=1 Tax=Escovopsis weberi TaxID=150374 RepID=A0A0M9VS58_ESCWE|nr:hypothetical protein ESCO_006370 [Escovopsis weberi]
MRKRHGADGVWACFQALYPGEHLGLLARDDSEHLRDEIVRSALVTESRFAGLLEVAHTLLERENFQWPDLYVKVMHFLLAEVSLKAAIRWHLQLIPLFKPEADVFGVLLASFVTDPTPKMQRTLLTLYISGAERSLYDHLIPALFASGQSQLALYWRKRLLVFGDHPSSSRSRQFLRFIRLYFPAKELTVQELAVIGPDPWRPASAEEDVASQEMVPEPADVDEAPKGIHSDSIVAKLFASTWTSAEFAINLAHRLGARLLGPRSLQSLALREQESQDLVARLTQLENLGIAISPQIYCKVLITFAKTGEDELLKDLVHCDVHPDEFEDLDNRQRLLAEARRQRNWEMERLFQGIEWALKGGSISQRLNSLLGVELSNRDLVRVKALLDRMRVLRISMTQTSAMKLLRQAFWGVGKYPWDRISETDPYDPRLDRAIDIARRIAHHDVAIPLLYWKKLLFNLGRSRRLSELEQLSLEILRHYTRPRGGLIPVHRDDLPSPLDSSEKEFIPADMPLSHHDHPLRRIFDHRLQRNIVRWAFDQTLAREPELLALTRSGSPGTFAEHDVARGVRLLAQLRDQGVPIDAKTLRSSVLTRIALGQIPGRLRSRARDSNELSVQLLKELLEEAWGEEIFSSLEDLDWELEAHKPRLWKRYPKLFEKAYA